MRVVLEPEAICPTRAHSTDAGADLYSIETKQIPPRSYATFHTGVHAEIPKGYAGLLVAKSGLNVKQNITSTGLIDEGYTGEIMVKLYNHGFTDVTIEKGQKITQLVLIPVLYEPIEVVSEIGDSERGSNGFGSTGK